MAPVDPDWIHGASEVEVVVFRLGPGSPGDGSGLWKEDISDLKADLEEADFRLAHEVTRSLWLERYRELLAESLRPSNGYSPQEWAALQPSDPQWWQGASPQEVIRFELSPLYPGPDGAGVGELSDEDLELHLREVDVRQAHGPTATAWLGRYGGWLAKERRRRG